MPKIYRKYTIKSASYLDGYRLNILFADGKKIIVDFAKAIEKYGKGYYAKYKNPSVFKRFKIEDGNVVWGKNWDLIFETEQLRNRTIETNP